MCMLGISVYTFGSPRTGNHAFAKAYNTAVPETWHLINDQVCGSAPSACPDIGNSYAGSCLYPALVRTEL